MVGDSGLQDLSDAERLEVAGMSEQCPTCPCETMVEEPGPHIPECKWADPNYEPRVCPGCHAVDERCAPGCIDDEMRRDLEVDGENELTMQDRSTWRLSDGQ